MKRLRLAAFLAGALGALAAGARAGDDLVIADFEGGLADWKAEGRAFLLTPAKRYPRDADRPRGYRGQGFVDSWDADHKALAGTLTSPEFEIRRPFLRFLIAGRGFGPSCSLQLHIDGKLQAYACGAGDRQMRPSAFDVSSSLGHRARLVVSDHGKWNDVAVDHIIAADSPGDGVRVLYPSSECVPLDRRIDLAGMRYLNLPINNLAQPYIYQLEVDGTERMDLTLRLAIDQPVDWWAALPVTSFGGKSLRLASRQPVVFKGHAPSFEESITLSARPRDDDRVDHERARPRLHFTPWRGQNNDPNGLFYYRGTYNLFYQHNPVGLEGGNQCWGHATSPDLFHWTEQPIAIFRGKGWQAFSGSAVVDTRNDSGLKQGDEDPILLFYSQNGRSATALACSTDGGRTFHDDPHNPLFLTQDPAGHDPKVVWYAPGRKWVMILHDLRAERWGFDFYESKDLLHWTYMSTSPGWWETPDLFPMALDGDPRNVRWVVQECGHTYEVGDFDGRRFVPKTDRIQTYYGAFLAPQTFDNAPDARRIMIGCTDRFAFHKDDPEMPVLGGMAIPVDVTLRTSPTGPRLYMNPVREIDGLVHRRHDFAGISPDALNRELERVEPELFDIEFQWEPAPRADFRVRVWGREVFAYDGQRSRYEACGTSREIAPVDGLLSARLIADRSICEFFINDGYEAGNAYLAGFAPRGPRPIEVIGEAGLRFRRFQVKVLKADPPTRRVGGPDAGRSLPLSGDTR